MHQSVFMFKFFLNLTGENGTHARQILIKVIEMQLEFKYLMQTRQH